MEKEAQHASRLYPFYPSQHAGNVAKEFEKFMMEEVGTASFTMDALDKIEKLLSKQIQKENDRLIKLGYEENED